MAEGRRVAIVGAGTMGTGIAHVFAQKGYQVNLLTRSAESAKCAIHTIGTNLDRQISKGIVAQEDKQKTLSLIEVHSSLEAACTDADLVIEAVQEIPALKFDVFKKLDALCRPDTILASTTSAISITQISTATQRPDRVAGMHFMHPVPVMNLVEIIRGYATSARVVQILTELTIKLGKVPVEANDYPGFLTSRILAVTLNEAIHTLYEGVAGVEEIDSVMKLGMMHPMGPLELADFVGLDVLLATIHILQGGFNHPKYAPCPLLVNMAAAGHLGRKTGKGFYEYSAGSKEKRVAVVL